jgi:hypothetical protein
MTVPTIYVDAAEHPDLAALLQFRFEVMSRFKSLSEQDREDIVGWLLSRVPLSERDVLVERVERLRLNQAELDLALAERSASELQ